MRTSLRRAAAACLVASAFGGAAATSAQAGTPIDSKYCSNVGSGNTCVTSGSNLPNGWTVYARAEMQGAHSASAGYGPLIPETIIQKTSNLVYSWCWRTNSASPYNAPNPQKARGVNNSPYTRNMEVYLFHSTGGGDCAR